MDLPPFCANAFAMTGSRARSPLVGLHLAGVTQSLGNCLDKICSTLEESHSSYKDMTLAFFALVFLQPE